MMVELSPEHTKKLWRVGLVSLVGLVVICVWVLYTIPTIVTFTSKDKDSEGGSDSGMCVQEMYDGVCREHLLAYQSCTSNSSQSEGSTGEGMVYIPASRASQERSAQILIPSLGFLMPSAKCEQELAPFLCLNLFGVCTDGGEVVRPSSGQCERLMTEVCASEWATAAELVRMFQTELSSLDGYNLDLPNCAALPNETTCDVSNINSSQHQPPTPVSANSSNDTMMAKRQCSQDFYLNDLGFCQPVCGEWKQYSATTTVAVDTIIILSCSIYLVATFVAMVLSCIQYKRMMKVPGVLAVYQLATASMIPLLLLVGYSNQKDLFCSDDDLAQSVLSPTTFCYINGFFQFFTGVHMTSLWLSQILVFLWGIAYPFQARRILDNHGRSLHLALLLVSSLPPLVVAAGTFGVGDYITRFPPVFCTSADPMATYYFLVIPLAVICATGVSALVIIFALLIRTPHKQKHIKAELKILVSLFHYVFLTMATITCYSIILRDSDKYADELFKYFTCESIGIIDGESCSRSGFESVDSTYISLPLIFILLAIYPFVLLIYIVNVEEIGNSFVVMKDRIIRCKINNKSSAIISATVVSTVSGSHQGQSKSGAADMEQSTAMEMCDSVDGDEHRMEMGCPDANGPVTAANTIGSDAAIVEAGTL